MEPATGVEETPSPAPPDWKKWVAPALVIVAAAIIASAVLSGLPDEPTPGDTLPISTPVTGTTVSQPVRVTPKTPVPLPLSLTPSGNRTVTPTPTWSGPPDFTVSVSPSRVNAARGETVVYNMRIEAMNGFSEEIHMQLVAGFLFFSQTEDLGVQEPPYPKTVEYPFRVPDSLFPGTTVNGVLTATGGGITHQEHLTLTVK